MDRPNVYKYKLEIISYSISLIICVGLLIWSLKLYNADLHVPFSFGGDALYTYAITKTAIENGWVWHNNALGAPYGLDNYDFPAFNFLDILIIKIISLFSSDAFFVENLFYLLTFPLTTLTSLIVFRQFNINYAYSALGSLLFTFMPYHLLRLYLDHLNAASYYVIPLMVMVLLWIYSNELILPNSNNTFSIKYLLSNRKIMASIIICILAGSCFKYYPYIFCIFLLIMGVLTSVKSWKKTPFFVSAVLIISVVLVVIVNYMPVIIYDYQNGANFGVIARQPADSEIYGMKIIQLLLPIYGHRIPIFSNFAEYYDRTAPLINENASSSLGVIAGFGFIILIAYIFFTSCGASIKLNAFFSNRLGTVLNGLSLLNLSAILFATIGGISTIVAYTVLTQFRSMNRISIFIAFFSIFAILILLQEVSEKFFSNKHDILICSIAFILLTVGMFDQTSNFYVPTYSDLKENHLNDKHFIANIESQMPKNAMIFQLPYMSFPESPTINKMACNSHLRAYLHSLDLRWSYPAMKGRTGDAWQKLVASMPVQDMLKTLSQTGFEGIYIDSYGFEDGGAQILSNITQTLGTKPLISDNGRLYFFDMTGYGKRIQANSSLKNASLIVLNTGWHEIEDRSGTSSRWMQADATITVYSQENCASNLSLRALSFYRNRTLEVSSGDTLAAQVAVPTKFINLTVPINLMKGANTMRLHVPEGCERPCDIRELNNSDSRCLSIAVMNAAIV